MGWKSIIEICMDEPKEGDFFGGILITFIATGVYYFPHKVQGAGRGHRLFSSSNVEGSSFGVSSRVKRQ
jgi:hypothetical protein